MANKRVKIYERVRVQGKWTSVSVEIPKLKPDNTLYLKDEREGKFRVSWYEGTRKQWHPTTCSAHAGQRCWRGHRWLLSTVALL